MSDDCTAPRSYPHNMSLLGLTRLCERDEAVTAPQIHIRSSSNEQHNVINNCDDDDDECAGRENNARLGEFCLAYVSHSLIIIIVVGKTYRCASISAFSDGNIRRVHDHARPVRRTQSNAATTQDARMYPLMGVTRGTCQPHC